MTLRRSADAGFCKRKSNDLGQHLFAFPGNQSVPACLIAALSAQSGATKVPRVRLFRLELGGHPDLAPLMAPNFGSRDI
jgi:hypothetical protein